LTGQTPSDIKDDKDIENVKNIQGQRRGIDSPRKKATGRKEQRKSIEPRTKSRVDSLPVLPSYTPDRTIDP